MSRLLLFAVMALGLAGTLAVSGEPAGEIQRADEKRAVDLPRPIGLAGCASSNCHGRSGGEQSPENAWRTSCSVWAVKDPHARAYDVLDPQKNTIAKKMQAQFDRRMPGYHPQKDPKCLACHANPGIPAGEKPDWVTLRSEGVSCEACHGNAERWVITHTGAKPESRNGLAELNDLGKRAATCAGCHVGGTGDMNHDMIAAGHPKLNFEFASHSARLPKHWRERDRVTGKDRGPDVLLQAWVAGVFAAGEATCDLSRLRQTRKDPWPELAEWNCYACHHDLMGKAWRPEAGFKLDAKAWTFPWPLGDADAADALVPGLGKRIADGALKVSQLMGEERLNAVEKLKDELRKEADKLPADAAERMFRAVEATKTPPDWDAAYRMYLTLGVLETVRREKTKAERPAVTAALKEVATALNLPDHPKEMTYDPRSAQLSIRKLTAALRAGWN